MTRGLYSIEAFFIKMLLWSAETLVGFFAPNDEFKQEYLEICKGLRRSINTGCTFTCHIQMQRLYNAIQPAGPSVPTTLVEEIEPPSTPKLG